METAAGPDVHLTPSAHHCPELPITSRHRHGCQLSTPNPLHYSRAPIFVVLILLPSGHSAMGDKNQNPLHWDTGVSGDWGLPQGTSELSKLPPFQQLRGTLPGLCLSCGWTIQGPVEKVLSELCSTTCSLGDIGPSLSLCFHFLSDVAIGALPVGGSEKDGKEEDLREAR
jgi:hypothetical protein